MADCSDEMLFTLIVAADAVSAAAKPQAVTAERRNAGIFMGVGTCFTGGAARVRHYGRGTIDKYQIARGKRRIPVIPITKRAFTRGLTHPRAITDASTNATARKRCREDCAWEMKGRSRT